MKNEKYGWLPANVIQPTNDREVVVIIEDTEDHEHKLIEIGYYENNRWHFSCDDEETKHVTYWFPIPSWY